MRITLKLFAILREKAGTSQTTIELPNGATVAKALDVIGASHPLLQPLSKLAVAVNQEYAPADRVLNDGDELALLPAVSGGCP